NQPPAGAPACSHGNSHPDDRIDPGRAAVQRPCTAVCRTDATTGCTHPAAGSCASSAHDVKRCTSNTTDACVSDSADLNRYTSPAAASTVSATNTATGCSSACRGDADNSGGAAAISAVLIGHGPHNAAIGSRSCQYAGTG